MAVGDAYVFLGFLTPVLTQLFFPKPPTTFLTCFCRGERRKNAGKKVRLNRGSNSQPPDHEFDTLTNEPPGRGLTNQICWHLVFVMQMHKGDLVRILTNREVFSNRLFFFSSFFVTLRNIIMTQQSSLKRGLKAFAKGINPWQPALSAQAAMD